MRIPSVLLLCSFIVLVHTAAIAPPPPPVSTQTESPTPEVGYEKPSYEASIETRGNVKDDTILEYDEIPEHLEYRESLWTRALALLQRRETDVEATDRLLFNTNMDAFLDAKRQQNPATLDWSDDGCTSSPDKPLGFNFLPPCQRHDFGYRNSKKQNRFPANKANVDNNFKADMYAVCKTKGLFRRACEGMADTYYAAVKEFGSL